MLGNLIPLIKYYLEIIEAKAIEYGIIRTILEPGVWDAHVDVVDAVEVKVGLLTDDLVLEGLDLATLLQQDHFRRIGSVNSDAWTKKCKSRLFFKDFWIC